MKAVVWLLRFLNKIGLSKFTLSMDSRFRGNDGVGAAGMTGWVPLE
jgi:hypothetical protein